jgi:hypothetical protein
MEGENRKADVLDVSPNPHEGGRAIAQQCGLAGVVAIQRRGRGLGPPELVKRRLICPEFPALRDLPVVDVEDEDVVHVECPGVALCRGAKQGTVWLSLANTSWTSTV